MTEQLSDETCIDLAAPRKEKCRPFYKNVTLKNKKKKSPDGKFTPTFVQLCYRRSRVLEGTPYIMVDQFFFGR